MSQVTNMAQRIVELEIERDELNEIVDSLYVVRRTCKARLFVAEEESRRLREALQQIADRGPQQVALVARRALEEA